MAAVCAFCALSMTGLVWFVQVVHYPLFAAVGEDAWRAYHAAHTRRTGWVVAPLMIGELASAAVLAVDGNGALGIAGLALAAATWVLTFALAVPGHRRIAGGFDTVVAGALVREGWLRTAAWTAHGCVALAILA
jgi:hypothetical protein